MYTLPRSADELERIRADRLEADRRYNEALTALDHAVQALERTRAVPDVPPTPDDSRMRDIGSGWRVSPGEAVAAPGSPLRRHVAGIVWRVVAPLFARQEAFNAAVADQLSRNVTVAQRTREAFDALLLALREQRTALERLHAGLIGYVQQITLYVDTKDREVTAVSGPLAAGLSALDERLARHAESVAVAHHLATTAKRALDRLVTRGTAPVGPGADVEPGPAGPSRPAAPASLGAPWPALGAPGPQARGLGPGLDAYKYVGFEDRFRGSREDIRARQATYVPTFAGASDVLDVGCGRGEFLDLLQQHGIGARGLDANHEMVELCRARGFDVAEGDALAHLQALPDGALGGLFAAQVVEHLAPEYLVAFLETAHQKLRPGSAIVLETINPACWTAFFESYLRDPTHVRPLHPDTLSYLVTASGFQDVALRYSSPYPEHAKLQPVPGDEAGARIANQNTDTLNRLLFGYMDYAVVGLRR
jgi:SAM-dependent methyltransferase